MTLWHLKCELCGSQRTLNAGFNLYEFKKVYLFCKTCQQNTFHIVLGHE